MLFIEYDVHPDGQIELVALVNATEEDDQDPSGEAWMEWRSSDEFDDKGLGSVGVQPDDLAELEAATDPEALRSIVERIILQDRALKEELPS
jgi:hypothetical protein